MADGAQLGATSGATSCGAEVAATSAPVQRKGKYLGAKIHGAEMCYLGGALIFWVQKRNLFFKGLFVKIFREKG
jgi:hypothetical protein